MNLRRLCLDPDLPGGGGTSNDTKDEPKLVSVEVLRAKEKALLDAEARLAKIEGDRKAADEKASAEAGEWKALYEPLRGEHETAKARLAELETREAARVDRVKERNDARIKALPEKAAKALAPIVGKLSPDDLADWLETSLPSLVDEPAGTQRPAGTISHGKRASDEPIPAACTLEWERYGKALGMSERDWFNNNKARFAAKRA